MNGIQLEQSIVFILDRIDLFSSALTSNQKIAQVASKIIKGLGIGLLIYIIGIGAIGLGALTLSLVKTITIKAAFKKMSASLIHIFVIAMIKGQVVSFCKF